VNETVVPALRFSEFSRDWEETSIGDCLSKVIDYRGKAPPKADAGVPLITARNVRVGYLDFDIDEYIDAELFESWMNRGRPKHNDVLFTTEAPLGNVALFPKNGIYAMGQRIITLQTKPEECESLFLYQFLLGPIGQKRVDERGTGSTAKGIKSKLFVKIPFSIPSLAEQRKIAEFLGAVDARVGLLRQRRDALRAYKKGMMQRLFSQDLRFTKPDGSPFPDWQEKRLAEVAVINPKNGALPDRFQYIDLESVTDGRLAATSTFKDYEAPERAQRIVQEGDILFQTVRPYQRNNLFFEHGENYVASTGYAQIRSKTNTRFLYQLLSTVRFVDQVLKRCTGTSYPAINSTDLAGIEINLPHPEEQQKIADALAALDVKINAVTAQMDAMLRFKKGLLQQMFV
jgi:type I restriction enzyme, S subunit